MAETHRVVFRSRWGLLLTLLLTSRDNDLGLSTDYNRNLKVMHFFSPTLLRDLLTNLIYLLDKDLWVGLELRVFFFFF